MKIALVFPPLADATQPYSSLPALAGFLRGRERHEVMLHDANVEFVRHVLTGSCLYAAASRIATETPSEAWTISGGAQFGRTSTNMSRRSPAPFARAAVT